MCGVPHHAAKNYIETLVAKGYKVAICEQTEDPKQAKGVVKREVVQLVTPGTIMEGKTIDGKTNHFLAAAEELSPTEIAFAYLDVSTGEANTSTIEGSVKELIQQLQAYTIRELIVTEQLYILMAEQATNYGIVLSRETEEMEDVKAGQYVSALPKKPATCCEASTTIY